MAVAFILFVVIVCYHCYEYMLKKIPVLQRQQNALRLRKRIPRVRKLEKYETEEKNHEETWKNADRYDLYTDGAVKEADPDHYITPPIIRPAMRPDQLREPALDVLAPSSQRTIDQPLPLLKLQLTMHPKSRTLSSMSERVIIIAYT